jgi:hypothetical protein
MLDETTEILILEIVFNECIRSSFRAALSAVM